MQVKCYFKDCENKWVYKGISKHYITCTKCGRRISLKKILRLKNIERRLKENEKNKFRKN